jgi:hypothetical protein
MWGASGKASSKDLTNRRRRSSFKSGHTVLACSLLVARAAMQVRKDRGPLIGCPECSRWLECIEEEKCLLGAVPLREGEGPVEGVEARRGKVFEELVTGDNPVPTSLREGRRKAMLCRHPRLRVVTRKSIPLNGAG